MHMVADLLAASSQAGTTLALHPSHSHRPGEVSSLAANAPPQLQSQHGVCASNNGGMNQQHSDYGGFVAQPQQRSALRVAKLQAYTRQQKLKMRLLVARLKSQLQMPPSSSEEDTLEAALRLLTKAQQSRQRTKAASEPAPAAVDTTDSLHPCEPAETASPCAPLPHAT